jgi:uncharacterized protein YkwD
MSRLVYLAIFALLPIFSTQALPADGVPLWAIEKELLEHTNAQRAAYGLPALELDARLLDSARRHCFWMARARVLQHTGEPVAENIALGQRTTREVMGSWMSSPGHRANMLGNYRRLGMAAYETHDGMIYWCLQFLP